MGKLIPRKCLSLYMIKNEQWIDILGYEDLYQISNLGQVKSLKRYAKAKNNSQRMIDEKILRFKINHGYCTVTLCKNGHCSLFRVHRLVAINFISNPLNLPQVNHINGNKLDNCLDNLEWCTASENMKHSYKIGIRTPPRNRKGFSGKLHVDSKPVIQYTLSGEFVKEHDSIGLVRRDGFTPQHVHSCCNGKLKTHKNYLWQYK